MISPPMMPAMVDMTGSLPKLRCDMQPNTSGTHGAAKKMAQNTSSVSSEMFSNAMVMEAQDRPTAISITRPKIIFSRSDPPCRMTVLYRSVEKTPIMPIMKCAMVLMPIIMMIKLNTALAGPLNRSVTSFPAAVAAYPM